MVLYDGFCRMMSDTAVSISEEDFTHIEALCECCETLWAELDAKKVDISCDESNKVLCIYLYFDRDEITIKKNSCFWKLLELADGLEIEYEEPNIPITKLIVDYVYSE